MDRKGFVWFELSSVSRRCNADVTEISRRSDGGVRFLWCSFDAPLALLWWLGEGSEMIEAGKKKVERVGLKS